MEIAVTIILIGIVVVFTFFPLFSRKKTGVYSAGIRNMESLEFDRQNILTQINELDFDHQMENISDEDYQSLKDELLNHLSVIESRLNGNTVENVCPACGNPITAQDKFCGSCGTALN